MLRLLSLLIIIFNWGQIGITSNYLWVDCILVCHFFQFFYFFILFPLILCIHRINQFFTIWTIHLLSDISYIRHKPKTDVGPLTLPPVISFFATFIEPASLSPNNTSIIQPLTSTDCLPFVYRFCSELLLTIGIHILSLLFSIFLYNKRCKDIKYFVLLSLVSIYRCYNPKVRSELFKGFPNRYLFTSALVRKLFYFPHFK